MRQTAPRVISLFVLLVGFVVLCGWLFDVPLLTDFLPGLVPMKVSTAVAFMLSSLLLYVLSEKANRPSELGAVLLPTLTILLFLIEVSMLALVFFGIQTGVDALLVEEQAAASVSAVPGVQSLATIFAFLVVGLVGLFNVFDSSRLRASLNVAGGLLFLVGAAAVMGYALGVPPLYYQVPGLSYAMALNTAILFALLGVGFQLTNRKTLFPAASGRRRSP